MATGIHTRDSAILYVQVNIQYVVIIIYIILSQSNPLRAYTHRKLTWVRLDWGCNHIRINRTPSLYLTWSAMCLLYFALLQCSVGTHPSCNHSQPLSCSPKWWSKKKTCDTHRLSTSKTQQLSFRSLMSPLLLVLSCGGRDHTKTINTGMFF